MMNEIETRKYEMFARVREFGATHAAAIPTNSLAADLLAQIGSAVDELSGHSATKATGAGTAREGTASRGLARETLRADLEAISRTARAMAPRIPNVHAKFKMPIAGRDQALLDAARAFAADATPLRSEFALRELPESFFVKLESDIAAFERALNVQRHGRETRIEAGAAIERTIAAAMQAVRQLDSIIRNRFGGEPAALAAWTSASRVQRAGRSAKPADSQPVSEGGGSDRAA